MNKKLLTFSILSILPCGNIRVGMAQNNPYIDDKLFHLGFFIGVDMLSYHIEENDAAKQMELAATLDNLRLHRYLNLRFTPALHFGERTINYTASSIIKDSSTIETHILTIPVTIPLYLKWSAPRINNYRPYVVVGGGVEFECFRDKEKPILHKPFDAFVSAGFGCDIYFRWFKLSPEIKYQIGFLDAHTPITDAAENGWGIGATEYFYTNAIQRMTHQKLSIIFNFE